MEKMIIEIGDFFMAHQGIATIVNFLIKHANFIIGVFVNLILIGILCKLADTFNAKLEKKLLNKHPDSPLLNLMPILTRIVKVLIIFVIIASFLQSFGYNINSLIAGFGITGLAVGFAAKEAIGNVFGSIGLLADRVYKVGDYIAFDSYEGTVTEINFRSTTIKTIQGFDVNIPNNLLANNEITNYAKATERRIDLVIDIEYGTSNEKIDKACQILQEIAEINSEINDGALAFIENLASSSIQIRLVAYTSQSTWAGATLVKSRLIREIIHRYREEGIEFAFPSTSVYMADSSIKS